ncbi:MAG TPA: DnaA/Hda family protein [Gemmatimonadales bacterium]|nr:DnaA/Hda family protein [Gemmatimonadales bacterium]
MTDVLTAPPDFETFVLDAANRPAAAAARAVADASGVPYAPLVVVGAPGSGKTELLQAIIGRIRAQHPTAVVESLDPDELAERYRSALLVARGEMFRAELLAADLVLIDDLERLSRHQDCQGLVADLLDGRRGAGREMVVASSEPPDRLSGLDARLLRRLAEGTVVQLSLPGAEARYAILRRRLHGHETALLDDVVHAVADAEFASMRDYTGALSRLVAFQEASALPLTPRDALLLIGAPVAPVPEAAVPAMSGLPGGDEFGEFLSEVSAGLSEQVDRWRRRIGEAVLRWGGEGLRTRRLEALLSDEARGDPDAALAGFDADAKEVMALGVRAAQLAPDLAGAEVFRDPDQVAAARALVAQAASRSAPLTAPLAHYRWEDFAEGPGLRLPMMAARDIIAEPGRRYSPLVVVGASGTGKTHYLHALGNALAAGGVAPVACLGCHGFAAEVRALPDADALAAWRHHYRWVGALLLDDLQLLAGDHPAQEELIHLIGELNEGRRQMVLTADRPLEELAGLDARLLARLGGGLVVELPSPDREVRLAVIKRMLAGSAGGDDAALADFLAARPADSVRSVQGMVQRVLGEAAAQQVEPSPALAREVLDVMDIGLSRVARRPELRRGSGILTPGMGQVRSAEKTVMHWPSVSDRLLTELR